MKSVKKYTAAKVAAAAEETDNVEMKRDVDQDAADEAMQSSFVSVIMKAQHQAIDPSNIWGEASASNDDDT